MSKDEFTPMQKQGCQKEATKQQHQQATGSGGEGKGETAFVGIELRHHRPSPDTLSYCLRCGQSPLRSDRSRKAGYCGMCLRDDPRLPKRGGYVPPEVRIEGYWRNYLARIG